MKILNNGNRSFIIAKEDVIAYAVQSPRGDLFKDHAKVTFDPKTIITLKDEAGQKLVKAYGKDDFVVIEDAKPVVVEPVKAETDVVESEPVAEDPQAPVAEPKKAGRPRKV